MNPLIAITVGQVPERPALLDYSDSSDHLRTTADRRVRSGYEPRPICAIKQDRTSDILRLAQSSQWRHLRNRGFPLLRLVSRGVSFDQTRRNHVDSNTVWSQFQS